MFLLLARPDGERQVSHEEDRKTVEEDDTAEFHAQALQGSRNCGDAESESIFRDPPVAE